MLSPEEGSLKIVALVELEEAKHYLTLGRLESAMVCIRSATSCIEGIKVLKGERQAVEEQS